MKEATEDQFDSYLEELKGKDSQFNLKAELGLLLMKQI